MTSAATATHPFFATHRIRVRIAEQGSGPLVGRVRGVVGLSVPFRERAKAPPLRLLRTALGDGFYQIYFQHLGVADAELAWDVRSTFRRLLYSGSGDGQLGSPGMQAVVPAGRGFLDIMTEPQVLPDWLDEGDVDTFTREFEPTGLTGGLNW